MGRILAGSALACGLILVAAAGACPFEAKGDLGARARSLEAGGNLRGALHHLTWAIAADPENPTLQFDGARLLVHAGAPARAAGYLLTALRVAPTNPVRLPQVTVRHPEDTEKLLPWIVAFVERYPRGSEDPEVLRTESLAALAILGEPPLAPVKPVAPGGPPATDPAPDPDELAGWLGR